MSAIPHSRTVFGARRIHLITMQCNMSCHTFRSHQKIRKMSGRERVINHYFRQVLLRGVRDFAEAPTVVPTITSRGLKTIGPEMHVLELIPYISLRLRA
jgi:hypothetical protein